MNHSQYKQESELFDPVYLPLDYGYTFPTLSIPKTFHYLPKCALQNLSLSYQPSAFTRVQKECASQSFIVIRDIPKRITCNSAINQNTPTGSGRQHIRYDRADNESTHHSGLASTSQQKPTKDEKRHNQISSIISLVESRKKDTLKELEKYGDEDCILSASPKIRLRNSKLSHFRGVSNNGRKWQVMIMGFAKKIYFGGIDSEYEASQDHGENIEEEKEEKQDEITENSDVFLPSNDLLAKINSTTLYIKATNLIKEAQNLSNKIERSENIPFKEGCDELNVELKTREEIVQKLK